MLKKKNVRFLAIIVLMVTVMLVASGNMCFALPEPAKTDSTQLDGAISQILGLVRYGGLITALVVAMYLGISYITKSPEGKADVKKQLPLYIGGIAVLVFASQIVTYIIGAMGG